jgi:hypothetical protein
VKGEWSFVTSLPEHSRVLPPPSRFHRKYSSCKEESLFNILLKLWTPPHRDP